VQLRALISVPGEMSVPQELAMVRWYETIGQDEEEQLLGMQKLRWETIAGGVGTGPTSAMMSYPSRAS
jgi:hypothetical protein